MPSASPSPAKRPANERASSTVSLLSSSSGKTGTAANKQPRPHLVARHSRNVSHGRGLSNMGKKSMNTVYGEGVKHHRRVKSGTTTPVASPKAAAGGHMKRNSSHVVLPKNRSQGNLRKNQSTNTLTALNRNLSRGALNKLGAPADQKAKQDAQQKQTVFDLGDGSDEEEEEGEWEDSTASPELTRDNSKVSTPARAVTPNGEAIPPMQKHTSESRAQELVPDKTSSPPSPVVMKTNKSAPNLRSERVFGDDRPRQDPALLQQNGRGSRAPPAITTANARSSQQNISRNDSQRTLANAAKTSLEASESTISDVAVKTPGTSGIGTSTSTSAGVSHFLQTDPSIPRTPQNAIDSDDSDSVSDFMATYKPQPSESPDKPRTNVNRVRIPSQPSRTQQKLELQKRELMRGSGPPSTSGGLALSVGSSISLHSRTHSHSKNRSKTMLGEIKAIKQEYDSSVKQLMVVRRFRNPVLESIARLRQNGHLPNDQVQSTARSSTEQKRPPSRHGRATTNGTTTHASSSAGTHHDTDAQPTNHKQSRVSFVQPRAGGGRDSKVTFQLSRQDSHEDILAQGQESPGVNGDDYVDGLSPDEALIRRMWESRIHVA